MVKKKTRTNRQIMLANNKLMLKIDKELQRNRKKSKRRGK
jgi:hypothetical protein